MSLTFHISDTNPNPNDVCIAGGQGDGDCQGPYAILYLQEMESNTDPHPVLCFACLTALVNAIKERAEVQGQEPIDVEATEVPEGHTEQEVEDSKPAAPGVSDAPEAVPDI
jgi:hypothetical protein